MQTIYIRNVIQIQRFLYQKNPVALAQEHETLLDIAVAGLTGE